MKTLFIFVVIHVFMSSATLWHPQPKRLYAGNSVKFWTYPDNSNRGGYKYGVSNSGQRNYVPYYLPYENSASQGPVEYNTAVPLYNYASKYQNHSYAYDSAASNIQKSGTGNVAFSIYGRPVNLYQPYSHSNKMYLPGLNLDHNGSDLYVPSIDYVIKKLLLRLRNPSKKLIDIENALNLRSSYEPYWDSIIDEFVENFFNTNPGLSKTFQGTDIINIVPNFGYVIVSFTDFLKLRWGISLLNSNENLRNLFNSLINYKTTPENLNILFKEEITQNYFNNQDQQSDFNRAIQVGKELSNQQKPPVRIPPFQIPPTVPNAEDETNTFINYNEKSSTDGKPFVGFNHQHQTNKFYNHYDIYGGLSEHLTDNISKDEDLQNRGTNIEVSHNYAQGLNNVWIQTPPATMEPIPDYDVGSNNYNENNYDDLNGYPMNINNINAFKNICESVLSTFGDLTTILNKLDIDEELYNIKRLFKIVRQFIYIYNLDNIPFGDTVTTIGKILLDNDNLQANQMDIKIGLDTLLNDFHNGELGKLFEDVKYGRITNLKFAIDALGSVLYKYKQTLLQEGISEISTNLLLRIAINKSEKILSDYFAEECKRKSSNYIWKSLYSVLNLRFLFGGTII